MNATLHTEYATNICWLDGKASEKEYCILNDQGSIFCMHGKAFLLDPG